MNKFKIFSTFTGAGGLDIGFHGGFNLFGKKYKRLNFETVRAVEVRTEDTIYLVKISLKLEETMEDYDADEDNFDDAYDNDFEGDAEDEVEEDED